MPINTPALEIDMPVPKVREVVAVIAPVFDIVVPVPTFKEPVVKETDTAVSAPVDVVMPLNTPALEIDVPVPKVREVVAVIAPVFDIVVPVPTFKEPVVKETDTAVSAPVDAVMPLNTPALEIDVPIDYKHQQGSISKQATNYSSYYYYYYYTSLL
jgi:hypothetical protein